ncbi:MAG: hypothetical protein KKF67_00670 [Nanoarchaeota archaeon]|nr:hypothetical protein [Nanoarchaeota archaeon]
MGNKKSAHQKALELLGRKPEIIGIPRRYILASSIEQVIYPRGRPSQLDLVFLVKFPNEGLKAIIIEYKSNGRPVNERRGKIQLETAVNFYNKKLGIPAEGRFIPGTTYPLLKRT